MTPELATAESATEEYLYARINYERRSDDPSTRWDFKLETISHLLQRRGNPQDRYPIIHIAGTKGKGSIATMVAGILRAAGYRTGVYSSPHLEMIRERIAVDGELISSAHFCDLIDSFRPDVSAIDELCQRRVGLHPPTFFEIITAAAFDYFSQRRVDAAVIEVGMGGRLDSTNVCKPALTIISNIGIDHQRQLGATRSLIAAEKAGIIKPAVPLICGVTSEKPAAVIAEIARRNGAASFWLNRDFRCSVAPPPNGVVAPTEFSTWGNVAGDYAITNCKTNLIGRHQASNAAIAVAAAQWLARQNWRTDERAIRAGLQAVHMLGRFQVVPGRPAVILDIAHNEISVRAFVRTFCERLGPEPAGRTLVFSASRDKKIGRMLSLLLPHFDRVLLTKITGNPRGCPVDALWNHCERIRQRWPADARPFPRVQTSSDSAQAWQLAIESQTVGKIVAVTGSAFLVGEMLTILRNSPTHAAAFVDQNLGVD